MASSSLDPQIINADKRLQVSSSFKQYRPRMLKDFLKDDPFSCSSFPRKSPSNSNVTNKPSPLVLLRSGSRAAATTVCALNKVIKAVKFFPFASKAPIVLPRSISRKFFRRTNKGNETSMQVSVQVKDILRWRSFRDLAEEKSSMPLDFPLSSPIHYTAAGGAATTTTVSTSTTTSCSKRSSWCDSDFTVDSPLWGGEIEESWGEKGSKTRRNPEEDLSYEEAEQQSPVSVLDYPFCKEDESIFPFHPTFATRKSTIMQRLEQFESLAELVKNLGESHMDNHLVSDFFKDEMAKNAHFDVENAVKSWINGEYEDCEGQGVKEACVKEMERALDWKEFKDEQQEMAMVLEKQLLNDLLDQVLDDFVSEQ